MVDHPVLDNAASPSGIAGPTGCAGARCRLCLPGGEGGTDAAGGISRHGAGGGFPHLSDYTGDPPGGCGAFRLRCSFPELSPQHRVSGTGAAIDPRPAIRGPDPAAGGGGCGRWADQPAQIRIRIHRRAQRPGHGGGRPAGVPGPVQAAGPAAQPPGIQPQPGAGGGPQPQPGQPYHRLPGTVILSGS